jgi:hypothetical protein
MPTTTSIESNRHAHLTYQDSQRIVGGDGARTGGAWAGAHAAKFGVEDSKISPCWGRGMFASASSSVPKASLHILVEFIGMVVIGNLNTKTDISWSLAIHFSLNAAQLAWV